MLSGGVEPGALKGIFKCNGTNRPSANLLFADVVRKANVVCVRPNGLRLAEIVVASGEGGIDGKALLHGRSLSSWRNAAAEWNPNGRETGIGVFSTENRAASSAEAKRILSR